MAEDTTPPTLDELVATEPDKLDKITAALGDLVALLQPDEVDDPDFDAAPDTPYQIFVTYSDGREEQIDKVAEFHLVDTRTGEWPVGLASLAEDAAPVLGYWDRDAEFHRFDDRHRVRKGW
jgi:hypothetical protein